MSRNTSYILAGVFGILIIGAFVLLGRSGGLTKQALVEDPAVTSFATCLKDKGAIFYGAFWCPHCQAQKKMFGGSVKALPYVECSTPDGQGQLQVCKDKEVKSYPTWIYPDGTRTEGEQTFETLSQKTGCPIPPGMASAATTTP